MELGAHRPAHLRVLAGEVVDLRYRNGFPVRFASTSEPVQVKPGLWLAELQTGGAVELKPGDEVAVRGLNANCVFLRLACIGNRPARSRRDGTNVRQDVLLRRPFPQLRLAVQAQITGPAEAGAKHEARIKIVNPLPYAAEAVVDWKLADYFGKPVVKKFRKYIRLEPHAATAIVHPFTAESDGEPTSWTSRRGLPTDSSRRSIAPSK